MGEGEASFVESRPCAKAGSQPAGQRQSGEMGRGRRGGGAGGERFFLPLPSASPQPRRESDEAIREGPDPPRVGQQAVIPSLPGCLYAELWSWWMHVWNFTNGTDCPPRISLSLFHLCTHHPPTHLLSTHPPIIHLSIHQPPESSIQQVVTELSPRLGSG